LSAAESLAHGRGLRIAIASWYASDSTAPLAHFPPGYSTAIALPTTLGLPALQSARIVDALAAAVTAVTVSIVIVAASGPSIVSAIAAVLALILTPAIVEVHLSALSEPLFLAMLALTLLAMIERPRMPLLGGVAAAGAAMVRYAGIAVTGAVVVWAFLQRDSLRARVRRAVIAGLPTAVLQGAWVVRSRMVAGPRGIREAGIYGGFGNTLRMGGQTLVDWFAPLPYGESFPGRSVIAIVLLIGLAMVVAFGVRAARRTAAADSGASERGVPSLRALRACGLLAVCYVVVISLSRLFADPGIPFDNRILSPLELLATIASAIAIGLWWRARGLAARAVLAAALLGWASLAIYADYDTVSYAMSEGADFASSTWRSSPTLAWARANAAHVPLYSNWAAAIYFHLHRAAHEVPENDEEVPLTAFRDTLRARHGVVVAFDVPSPGLADPVTLERTLGLTELARLSDGRILGAPEGIVSSTPR
jgi:hypothetical protein